ncbi:leucine-rich repeat domain-containing protein [Clostridium beijerinckii]|uniref:leucine-rich repeat domain-containing protein n=1 Tax=Clostridium beijerinckii TaxID=1520 RepID=UPI0003D33911|nr:leucine-rich repeat domain-containing protein [Clostridium beijerinckii]ALB46029.1 cell wall-binding protein [Clostridium beijerinckii NRRL B-598]
MKKIKLTKVIANALVVASVLMLNPIGANAEWKHNLAGWWYAEGDSWATGWSEIDGKWYHFNSRGYMEHDKTIDGYYLDSSGAWKEVMTTSENLKFDKSTGTIVGYSGVNKVVNIPSEIDGVSVTSIGSGAFSTDNSAAKIENITIPNSVTSIGESAFEWDSNLKTISIPESVKKIEKATFNGCIKLTSVTMPNGLTSIGQGAFSSCGNLTNIIIPDNVTYIDNVAFAGCHSLRSIDIPKSVKRIGGGAFQNCDKLTSMNIHSSTVIGQYVFDGTPNVKITVLN